MPSPPVSSPVPGSPALLAFLRGIERRAWVFALSQCGDEALARHAVDSALREFVAESQGEAIARWPLHFWTALLRQPDLLSLRDDARTPLAALTVGPRAALLLRLVAGLDFSHAAEVLGVGESAYRFALARALEDWSRVDPAPGALEALRDDLLAQVKHLDPARIEDLAVLRSRALAPAGDAVHAPVAPVPFARPSLPRWPRWALVLLAVLVLAFIATFLWTPGGTLAPNATQSLPAEAANAPPGYEDSAIVTHPDYALLADSTDRAVIEHSAVLSWVAAGRPTASGAAAGTGLEESAQDEAMHSDVDREQSP